MHLTSPGLLYLHLYLLYLHGYLYYIPRNRPGLHSDLYYSWKDDSYTLILTYFLTILIIRIIFLIIIIIRIQYPTFLFIFNTKIYCPPSHPRAGRLQYFLFSFILGPFFLYSHLYILIILISLLSIILIEKFYNLANPPIQSPYYNPFSLGLLLFSSIYYPYYTFTTTLFIIISSSLEEK